MRASTLFALLCATAVEQALAAPAKTPLTIFQQKDDLVPKAVCAGPGGKVADPPGAAPRRVPIQVKNVMPGTQRHKLRYGPYLAPGMTKKSIMGEEGALWNCGDDQIEKPCEECMVTRIQAGLEYPNGTNANIDTGMWMHHMVALVSGPGRWDPTCARDNFSLPHLVVGATPDNSERMFASGNERTILDASLSKINNGKIGYHLRPEDKMRFIVDLMNMNMDDRVMYLTLTYDFIDGTPPKDYMDIKPLWFDADQCSLSEVEVTPEMLKEKAFTITSEPWMPNFEGDIALLGGHLHDGGSGLEFSSNGKDTMCDSSAKYGESPEYIFDQKSSMAGADIAAKHISSMTLCNSETSGVKRIEKGQSWVVRGKYDYEKYAGNFEGGEPQDIMGIGIMWVAVPQGGVPPPPPRN